MLTHGDWHDFTVSVLKMQGSMENIQGPSIWSKVLSYHPTIMFYISFTLHNIPFGFKNIFHY